VSTRETPANEIERFHKDVKLLTDNGMSPNKIGGKIPLVGGSNFINYCKGNKTITQDFLTKFYKAWGERLNELKRNDFPTDHHDDVWPATETENKFGGASEQERLANAEQTVWESNQLLAEAYKKLSDANRELVEIVRGRRNPPSKQ
jgi:hypothetical protein